MSETQAEAHEALVEAVEKAIYAAFKTQGGAGDFVGAHRDSHSTDEGTTLDGDFNLRVIARAALSAVREVLAEPSEGMVKAMHSKVGTSSGMGGEVWIDGLPDAFAAALAASPLSPGET